MPKKRPFASEGHLGLPRHLAPAAGGAREGPSTRATGPFGRGGRARIIPVADDRLEALDLRAGDRAVLVEGREPEFGDLALVAEEGAERLWKVFPEGDALRLSDGRTPRRVPAESVCFRGVVIAVLRAL